MVLLERVWSSNSRFCAFPPTIPPTHLQVSAVRLAEIEKEEHRNDFTEVGGKTISAKSGFNRFRVAPANPVREPCKALPETK